MWSWLTAAAAWASRMKRLRAVALVASWRGHHLDGHDAVQLLIEGPQHDAHAAAADDFQHLVMAQPAERAGLVRGAQKIEVVATFATRWQGRVQFRRHLPGRPRLRPAAPRAVFAETRLSARAFAAVPPLAAGAWNRRRRQR